MSDSAYDDVLHELLKLPPADRERLLVEYQAIVKTETPSQRCRSLLELEGLGKEIWQGIDAQRYVDEERASWDG